MNKELFDRKDIEEIEEVLAELEKELSLYDRAEQAYMTVGKCVPVTKDDVPKRMFRITDNDREYLILFRDGNFCAAFRIRNCGRLRRLSRPSLLNRLWTMANQDLNIPRAV